MKNTKREKQKSSRLKKSKSKKFDKDKAHRLKMMDIKDSEWAQEYLRKFEADTGHKYGAAPDLVHKIVNIPAEAKHIKSFKELERFVEEYMPSIRPADLAVAAVDMVNTNWLKKKILGDAEHHGAVFKLIAAVDKTKGGAKTFFHSKKHILRWFNKLTGYPIPNSVDTFQNHITTMKHYFGLGRKNTGAYKEAQLKAAALKYAKKK